MDDAKGIGDKQSDWAIASKVAASDPQVSEARKFFRAG